MRHSLMNPPFSERLLKIHPNTARQFIYSRYTERQARSSSACGRTPYSNSHMHKVERGNYIIMGGNTTNCDFAVNVNSLVGRSVGRAHSAATNMQ